MIPQTVQRIKPVKRVTGPETYCKVIMRGILIGQLKKWESDLGVGAEFTLKIAPPWRPENLPEKHIVQCYGKAVRYMDRAFPGDIIHVEGYIKAFEYTDSVTRRINRISKIICDFVHVCSGEGKYASEIENIIDENTH